MLYVSQGKMTICKKYTPLMEHIIFNYWYSLCISTEYLSVTCSPFFAYTIDVLIPITKTKIDSSYQCEDGYEVVGDRDLNFVHLSLMSGLL